MQSHGCSVFPEKFWGFPGCVLEAGGYFLKFSANLDGGSKVGHVIEL